MKINLTICLLFTGILIGTSVKAQEDNIFLNSDYWKSQPTIENIKEKIAKGADINAFNPNAFDGTCYAIFAGNPVKTIAFLTSKGNPVTKRTHDFRTYLFWAVSRGNLDVAKMLIDKGSDVNAIDSKGHSVLLFAATTGQSNTKLYDLLLDNGADIHINMDNGRNALHLLIRRAKDLTTIDYLVSKGLDMNSTDKKGNGIFNYAATSGNVKILKELVSRNIDYTANKNTGENAILFASSNSKTSIATFQYLEGLGLKANSKTNENVTPIHKLARSSANLKTFDYFIAKGVDVNQADDKGNTALSIAAYRNKIEVVKYLTEKTKNINFADKEGQSALTMAIQRNSPEVVDYLISKNADVFVVDRKGNNLAYYLVKNYRNLNIFGVKLESLTNKGFDPKSVQKDGSTLFHLAIDKNDLDLLKRVNQLNVDVNAKDINGNTVLHFAALRATDDKILKYLLSIGANTKVKTEFDESAYDLAMENELLKSKDTNIKFLK